LTPALRFSGVYKEVWGFIMFCLFGRINPMSNPKLRYGYTRAFETNSFAAVETAINLNRFTCPSKPAVIPIAVLLSVVVL
jgi:hypothetical protein